MPELAALRPYGLVPPVFQPENPSSYLTHQLPDAPIPNTSALSSANAYATVMQAATDALKTLPQTILGNYQAGKQMANQAQGNQIKQQILSGQISPGALSDLGKSGVNIGPSGDVSVKPPSPLEAALANARLETAAEELKLKQSTLDARTRATQRYNAIPQNNEFVAPSSAPTPAASDLPTQGDASEGDFSILPNEIIPTPKPAPGAAPPVPTSDATAPAPVIAQPDAVQQQIADAAGKAGQQLGAINPTLNKLDDNGVPALTGFTASSDGAAPAAAPLALGSDFRMDMAGQNKPDLGAPVNPAEPSPLPPPPENEVKNAVPDNGHTPPAAAADLKQGMRRQPDGSLVYYKDGIVTHSGEFSPSGNINWKSYQYSPNSTEGILTKRGYNPKLMTPDAINAALLSVKDPLKEDTVKDLTARRIPTFDPATGTVISNSTALAKLKADDDATGRSSLIDARNGFDVKKSFTGSDQYKTAYRQASSYNNFLASYNQSKTASSGAADIGILDSFIKTQNPGGVIRPSTAAMILKAQAMLDKYTPSYVEQKLKNGTFLDPKFRDELKSVMDAEIKENADYFKRSTLEMHQSSLKEMGGKPDSLVSPYDYFKGAADSVKVADDGMVAMKKPDGTPIRVPSGNVEAAKKLGAVLAQ